MEDSDIKNRFKREKGKCKTKMKEKDQSYMDGLENNHTKSVEAFGSHSVAFERIKILQADDNESTVPLCKESEDNFQNEWKIMVDIKERVGFNMNTLKEKTMAGSKMELKSIKDSNSKQDEISDVHRAVGKSDEDSLKPVPGDSSPNFMIHDREKQTSILDIVPNYTYDASANSCSVENPEQTAKTMSKEKNFDVVKYKCTSDLTSETEPKIVETCDIHRVKRNPSFSGINSRYNRKHKASELIDDYWGRLTRKKKRRFTYSKAVEESAAASESEENNIQGNNTPLSKMISKDANNLCEENIDSESEAEDRIINTQAMDPEVSPTRNKIKKNEKLNNSETCKTIIPRGNDDKDLDRDSTSLDRGSSDENEATEFEAEAKEIEEMLETRAEEEQLSYDSIQRLQSLRVQLRHTVPPQHQIESHAGSQVPTREQKKLFEYYGPIKKGTFTHEEDITICNNWKAFCKLHMWDSRDVKPFLYMRHNGKVHITEFKERQKFVQFLACGLPWRTLYSVYYRFRNLYCQHLQTRYKPEDDKKIMVYMAQNSSVATKNAHKFSELALILKRTRASVWRRYQLLRKSKGIRNRRVTWTAPVIKKFIAYLLELTLSENILDLKDATIPHVVWNKLGEKMDVEPSILKNFWHQRLHMQLFCTEKIYMNDIKIKLIEYFFVKGLSEYEEVVWSDVAKYFDGMTSLFLSIIFTSLFYRAARNLNSNELYEIVEYLHAEILPKLRIAAEDKFLPRIFYKNGKIKFLDIVEKSRNRRRTL